MADLVKPVLASTQLEPAAFALLLEIRRRVEAEGGECSASSPELGNAAGVCPRQAQRLIKGLQKAGWITVEWTRHRRWLRLAPGAEAAG